MRAKLLTIRDVAGRLVRIDPDDLSRFLHRAPGGRPCP